LRERLIRADKGVCSRVNAEISKTMTKAWNILHVDDDANDLLLLKHACRTANLNYCVEGANDGEIAISYLSGRDPYANRQQYPVPDLLLLDLKMPRKTGFEVLQWIRDQPSLRRMLVFVFTSSRHQEDIDRAYELGANGYLVKPVGFERLVEELQALNQWLGLNERPTL
jgi:CheY-like chemotaxis protein